MSHVGSRSPAGPGSRPLRSKPEPYPARPGPARRLREDPCSRSPGPAEQQPPPPRRQGPPPPPPPPRLRLRELHTVKRSLPSPRLWPPRWRRGLPLAWAAARAPPPPRRAIAPQCALVPASGSRAETPAIFALLPSGGIPSTSTSPATPFVNGIAGEQSVGFVCCAVEFACFADE